MKRNVEDVDQQVESVVEAGRWSREDIVSSAGIRYTKRNRSD